MKSGAVRKVLCLTKFPATWRLTPDVVIRAPRLVPKRGSELSKASSQGLSLSHAPQGKGHGNGPQLGWSLSPTGPQSSEVRKSGDRGAEEGNIVATSPSPFKTPEAGRLPRPHQLPSQAPSWEEGAACAAATGQGREGGWQVLQSTVPGPVRGQAINDRAGERSQTAAVFRNLSKESRDQGGQAAAGLQAPA